MSSTVKTRKELIAALKGNYIQVILKNGNTFHKLFKDPQKAIREVGGVGNVRSLREVLKSQVNARYADVDALEGKKEGEL